MSTATPNRAYRIPQSTDGAVNLTNNWINLGTDVDTDVAAILATYLVPVKQTSTAVATAATNFTVTGVQGRTLCNGKFVHVRFTITTANALTATTGDITDVTCCTLTTGYRPTETVPGVVDGGAKSTGVAILNTDGTVVLRSFSDTVTATSGLTISFTFIKD